ncbi:MAG TPA: Gfo/Idh/MocA family oxidoreductase [Ktedonobacterales bacterium]|nr:Gfo/Idh/MocA family oxidoreductase [Ktedonobacterales bacterium]
MTDQTRVLPTLGVGMLGYAFMGKAHTNAYKTLEYTYTPPPAHARLVAIAGRDQASVEAAARRYGYEKAVTDWRALIADPDVQVFDDGAPNSLHAEPSIAALRAGKHVICEKPLGRDAAEAKRMWEAARQASQNGIVSMCGFNYRFVPAIRLARDIIKAGRLGRIYHFRANYLQEGLANPNTPVTWRHAAETAGSGALGDLGTHIIDLARFLVGEPTTVSSAVTTFVAERPTAAGARATVTVDDAFAAAVTFENGAIGLLEATRYATGRRNHQVIEINGEKGSLAFNLERLNELEVYLPTEESPRDAQGFRQVLVTEHSHPFYDVWWPHGHIIGWEHTFIHEIHHFFEAIVSGHPVKPDGADFEDGYRACVIADAIKESSSTGQRVAITY